MAFILGEPDRGWPTVKVPNLRMQLLVPPSLAPLPEGVTDTSFMLGAGGTTPEECRELLTLIRFTLFDGDTLTTGGQFLESCAASNGWQQLNADRPTVLVVDGHAGEWTMFSFTDARTGGKRSGSIWTGVVVRDLVLVLFFSHDPFAMMTKGRGKDSLNSLSFS